MARTDEVLNAMRMGAETTEQISARVGIPRGAVASILSKLERVAAVVRTGRPKYGYGCAYLPADDPRALPLRRARVERMRQWAAAGCAMKERATC